MDLFYTDAHTAKRDSSLFRCSNRVEMGSDNLKILRLLEVSFTTSGGWKPNSRLHDCVKRGVGIGRG